VFQVRINEIAEAAGGYNLYVGLAGLVCSLTDFDTELLFILVVVRDLIFDDWAVRCTWAAKRDLNRCGHVSLPNGHAVGDSAPPEAAAT